MFCIFCKTIKEIRDTLKEIEQENLKIEEITKTTNDLVQNILNQLLR